MKNNKYFYLTGFVFLLILTALVFYLLGKNAPGNRDITLKNNTSSNLNNNAPQIEWTTHKDDVYKFEISYPASWNVTKDPKLAGGDYAIFWVAESANKGYAADKSLLVMQALGGKVNSLKDYIEDVGVTPFFESKPNLQDSEIRYYNNETKAVIKNCDVGCTYYIYHLGNDEIYHYIIFLAQDDEELAMKISNTFKEIE